MITKSRSRVEAKALELMEAGQAMSKYDLSRLAHCDQRTAQRILARIHSSDRGVRISRWVSIYRAWIPVYKLGRQVDVPRPAPLTSSEIMARRRKSLEVRWEEMMKKRSKRLREQSERGARV